MPCFSGNKSHSWAKILPLQDKNAHYIFGELFPLPPFTNKPPAELFAAFKGNTNLLYYDWELTHQRMPHANQFFQLHDIVSHRRLPPASSVAQKWTVEVATNLANCTTEITLASPTELKLVRKSQLGFTGFELVGLAHGCNQPISHLNTSSSHSIK